jgi:hypothetical protein
MSNLYDQSPRFSATGVTTGSILALIVAMGISLLFDVQPADTSPRTAVVHTVSKHA